MVARTLFQKIWESHLVARRIDGREIIYMDRNIVHELHGPKAFEKLRKAGRRVRRPDLTFAVQDHTISSRPGRDDTTNPEGTPFLQAQRAGAAEFGFRIFDVGDPDQGISHVIGPELGMVLPGATHCVPDSHAATVGALGALSFGCGTTELEHVLATQVLAMKRPKTMRINLEGRLQPHVTAKDVALHIIGTIGVSGANGHVVEYAGAVVRAMGIEARMTLCNLTVEMGGRSGFVAADETTLSWLQGRPFAPTGDDWARAEAYWRTMHSDQGAEFDRDITIDCTALEPQITWGITPGQVIGIRESVPVSLGEDASDQHALTKALTYMDLRAGEPLQGLKVDRVFIGSCTNGRIPDLQEAAAIVRGRKVAEGVVAMISPGSTIVRREAEALGLDAVFRDAGFYWAESACSMCAGGNGDRGRPGERVISTTNRNFEGRQGPGVRTHLVSAGMAAAAAIAGSIVDVRQFPEA
ncbi:MULTISPECIES: 3-isopropylmalate dehydratase large subunit [unclassified Chelatococcus]|uniref:3-isopropylmalate dehydratase large subunit n=1 Tax=unclassified Chelatococcus TaxID=2638111 RepID=UPI001BCF483E|nr:MULTISPECIES: 3-isopropylmalate dehydratase large subunit [unclassified Chelatococcus]MBS7697217.1 3-isopropylmalate dehydratase large subunit [Chelatococcus sp. YT9]MBX3556486.1 3-isopropylmalate dehydratase large subunit [Chelatococcus sp.]